MIFTFDTYQFINESNKIQKYFEENPDKLQKFSEIDYNRNFEIDEIKKIFIDSNSLYDNPISINYRKNLDNLLKKFDEAAVGTSWNDKYSKSFKEYIKDYLFSSWNNKIYSSYEEFKNDKSWVERDILEKSSQSGKLIKFLKSIWTDKTIFKLYKLTAELKSKESSYWNKIIKKEADSYGFTVDTFLKCISQIKYYTSGSRRTIPENFWPVLKALTIKKNNLPSKIYRGIFYDGAKIKDKQAFLKKWAPGSYPKEGLKKATSWSTSIGTAFSFTTSQDFIKDEKNGFKIVIAIDNPSEDIVIADFRNIWFGQYWNQQEILIDPKAKNNYYVVEIIENEESVQGLDYEQQYPKEKAAIQRNHAQKSNGGAWGISFKEFIRERLIDLKDYDFDKNLMIELKSLNNKTGKEIFKKYNIIDNYYDKSSQNSLLFLRQFLNNNVAVKEWNYDYAKGYFQDEVQKYYTIGKELAKILGVNPDTVKEDFDLKNTWVELPCIVKCVSTEWNNKIFEVKFLPLEKPLKRGYGFRDESEKWETFEPNEKQQKFYDLIEKNKSKLEKYYKENSFKNYRKDKTVKIIWK